MMGRLLFLALLISGSAALAQNNYDSALIPKELLPYASAVVRDEETSIEVKDLDNVIYHIKKIITVLNSNGDDQADLFVHYDKTTSVRSIRGAIYNEFGKLTQKIREHDFEDIAASDGFSLFRDDRFKHYTKAITQYPYTIEFEYEVKTRQSLDFPDWSPSPDNETAVEKSTYTFICKPAFAFRYKEINVPSKVVTASAADGMKSYTWEVKNMKARRYEPLSPNWRSMLTRVIIAPEKFSYENYNGTFSNWQQLGQWMYDDLIKDRETLPGETVQHIKDLTADITDPKLKAKKIYEYMQQKTHYISVQIGIGGWRPFAAADVDKDGYGDCKALVNYTKSLLKAAGIDSWYCVVYGNHHEKLNLLEDFASLQGNHVILCLPFKNDTTWLECTSQQIPFGFLSDFTDDRIALACTPDGGKLMHTPKYTANDNLVTRKAEFTIGDDGVLAGSMQTAFRGTDYDDREGILRESQQGRIRDLKKYYPINNLDIKSLEYKQDKDIKPVTYENIKLSANEYGAAANGKFYFLLNSIDRYSEHEVPKQVRNRQNPVCINRGWTEDDNISYTLPKGYKLESDPLNISIEKPFGSFSVTMTVSGDQLIYKRKLQMKDGAYSKDLYPDVVDFYESVADADNYNVILAKN